MDKEELLKIVDAIRAHIINGPDSAEHVTAQQECWLCKTLESMEEDFYERE